MISSSPSMKKGGLISKIKIFLIFKIVSLDVEVEFISFASPNKTLTTRIILKVIALIIAGIRVTLLKSYKALEMVSKEHKND